MKQAVLNIVLLLVLVSAFLAAVGTAVTSPWVQTQLYRNVAYGTTKWETRPLNIPSNVYKVVLSWWGCDDAGEVYFNNNLIQSRLSRDRDENMNSYIYRDVTSMARIGQTNDVKFLIKDLYGGDMQCTAAFDLHYYTCDGTDSSCGVYPNCVACMQNQYCRNSVCTTLTSIALSPASVVGTSQQFSATCYSGSTPMTCPQLAWSTTLGSVTSAGLWSAGSGQGQGTVTATAGTVSGSASVRTPECTTTTTYTCERITLNTAAGTCPLGACTNPTCPSGYVLSSNNCVNQGWGTCGGSALCAATTRSTYTSTTGCSSDREISRFSITRGCETHCYGLTYKTGGTCVNGACQYSSQQQCTAGMAPTIVPYDVYPKTRWMDASTSYTGNRICSHDNTNCLFSVAWQTGNYVSNLGECTDSVPGNGGNNQMSYWQVLGNYVASSQTISGEACTNYYNKGHACLNAVCGGSQSTSGFYPKTRWMSPAVYTGAQVCAHEGQQCLFTKWIQSGTYTNIISDCTTPVDAQSTGPNSNNYWQVSGETCQNAFNQGKSCVQALCSDGPAGDVYPKTRWFSADQTGDQICQQEGKECVFAFGYQKGNYVNNIFSCKDAFPASGGNNQKFYIAPTNEQCTNDYNLGHDCIRFICQDKAAPAPSDQGAPYCQGDNVMRNDTVQTPTCTSPNRAPITSTCTSLQVTEGFGGLNRVEDLGWQVTKKPNTDVSLVDGGLSGKALQFTDQNPDAGYEGFVGVYPSVKPTSSGSIAFDVKAGQVTGMFSPKIASASGTFIYAYLKNGRFQYWDTNYLGGYRDFPVAKTYSANQWYRIEIKWYGSTTFDFIVDGVKLTPTPVAVSYPQHVGSVTGIGFDTSWDSSRPVGTFWLDNVQYPGCAGGCGAASSVQAVVVQACANGCNPTTKQCYPECRPGSTQQCSESGFQGVQTCNATGYWGECTLDLSSLCRAPPNVKRFGGKTTDVDALLRQNRFLDLKALSGFVLEAPGSFRINFNSPVNLCNVDLDAAFSWGEGWLAVKPGALSQSFAQPPKPASVVLYNAPTTLNPVLFYSQNYYTSREDIIKNGAPCPKTKCSNLSFAPSMAFFNLSSFSSFAVGESTLATSPTSLKEVLSLECPTGIVAEEDAKVYAFYYKEGVAECVEGLLLNLIANGSVAESRFESCKAGKHVFWVNTTIGGPYSASVTKDEAAVSCKFEAVKKKTVPAPEMHEVLILLVALLAFVFIRRRRNQTRVGGSRRIF